MVIHISERIQLEFVVKDGFVVKRRYCGPKLYYWAAGSLQNFLLHFHAHNMRLPNW